jgi:hypothetical protein
MDRFDADVMEDLMGDAAEGPARAMDEYDAFDEDDGFDEYNAADEGEDAFLGRLIGGIGRIASGLAGGGAGAGEAFDEGDEFDEGDGFEAADGYDEFDEYDSFAADGGDGGDAMEDAVADAMDAGDSDEFFRRLRRIARGIGRGVGNVARVVGPIASMLPIPQAQLIGRIANVAGRLLADGADEFETFDDFVDGLDDDGIDAAAPVLAGMVLRRALPGVARAARPVRRAAVRAVTRAVRTAVRRQGPQGARAVVRAVRATNRIVQQRRLPARQAARAVRQVTQQVVRRPEAVRRLARPLVPVARRVTPRAQAARVVASAVAPMARRVAAVAPGTVRSAGGMACPHCQRRILARGPVTINLRCR